MMPDAGMKWGKLRITTLVVLDLTTLGVVHKLRGQDEVGRWSIKCPRLST